MLICCSINIYYYKIVLYFLFQINAVLLNNFFSPDTEYWSNDAENSALPAQEYIEF